MTPAPSIEQIRATASRIAPYVLRTPVMPCYGSRLEHLLPTGSELWLKLELLQRTGSFKSRGAVNVMMHLEEEQKRQGVTAFSAGNHAIATAFAADILDLSAKVAMPRTANPYRVERCRAYGADIVFADTIGELVEIVAELQEQEGRALVHPFEGVHTTEGTATCGLEFAEDVPELETVVVPVGGGGLISGVAAAFKALQPGCRVIGVEPEGAAGMRDSIKAGTPMAKVEVNTIADSLGAPLHGAYSFSVVQQCVDDMVTVSDRELKDMMGLMHADLKLVAEPACAAALAAIAGPLRESLQGQRIGALLCGSNIDLPTFTSLVD